MGPAIGRSFANNMFPHPPKIPILNETNAQTYGEPSVKKIQIGFVISIVVLFLGWLPKLGADRVFWYLDNDFAHYYLTGALVRSGVNPYVVNLSPLYGENEFTPTRDIPQPSAPPPLAVLMAPFSVLAPFESFCVWTAVQVGALLLGVVLLLKTCGVARTARGTLLLMLASLAPLGMFAHIRYGQTQALMFGLVAFGIVLLSRPQGWGWRFGAVLWGVSASLKLFTAPLGWVALRHRGWEGLCWFVFGFSSLWGIFWGLCGWDAIRIFFLSTLPYLRELSVAFHGNISLSGAVTFSQRVLAGRGVLSVSFLQTISVLLVLPFLLWERKERADLVASTMMVLVASCLLSPTAWPHYLPLLTGGFVYLLAKAQRSAQPEASHVVTLVLYVCMGVAMGYISRGDMMTQVISIWWGPMCMLALFGLLCEARRESGFFRR
jgi:hypothetical protein